MQTNNHIQEELKEIAPTLANMTKVNGYVVPKGYFNKVEPTVLDKIETPIESNNIEGYQIPDDYFNSFNSTVLDAIETKPLAKQTIVSTKKQHSIYRILTPIAGIAAALTLLFTLVIGPGEPAGDSPEELRAFIEQIDVLDPVVQAMLFSEEETLLMDAENMEWLEEDTDELDDLLDNLFEEDYEGFDISSI